LTLDELNDNDKEIINDGDIRISFDERMKKYFGNDSLSIDFRESYLGPGFVIDGAGKC
jgi:Fe-S cluster assembly iron-binding protein IscA